MYMYRRTYCVISSPKSFNNKVRSIDLSTTCNSPKAQSALHTHSNPAVSQGMCANLITHLSKKKAA